METAHCPRCWPPALGQKLAPTQRFTAQRLGNKGPSVTAPTAEISRLWDEVTAGWASAMVVVAGGVGRRQQRAERRDTPPQPRLFDPGSPD